MGVSVCMRRLLRMAFCERAERLWRLKPGPAFTLPVAVILNRFLTDDLVFILGIWISSGLGAHLPGLTRGSADSRGRACPTGPGARWGAVCSRGGGAGQGGGGRPDTDIRACRSRFSNPKSA